MAKRTNNRNYKTARRNETGVFFYLAFLGLIPLAVAIGALAIDFMHYNSVQAEVQRASDAGALAGAQQLWQYGTNSNAPIVAAESVAGWNDVDGQPLNAYNNASITAHIETAPNYSTQPASAGTVRCNITFPYKNIWSGIFGAWSQTCIGTALAGCSSQGNEALSAGLWPAAVSIDIPDPQTGKALYQDAIGSTVNFQWHSNVEWTGFNVANASTVSNYEATYNNPSPGSSNTPSPVVDVNSTINVTKGIQDSNIAAMSAYIGDIIVMPVISDSGTLGAGNYTVIGFVGLKLLSINTGGTSPTMTGILVPPATLSDNNTNAPAVGSTPNGAWNTFLASSKPTSPHLIQ